MSDRVGPLENALFAPHVVWQSESEGEDSGVEGGEVVPLLSTRDNLQHGSVDNTTNVNIYT